MRSCLLSGVLAALLTFTTVSEAQIDTSRPVRGVSRPPTAPAEAPAIPAAVPRVGGITVPRDSKLTAGDQISISIKEDHDPALLTYVTDTGEVELNGLGRVYVAGRSSMEAEMMISAYLKQRYYHRATVEVGIVRKAEGTVKPLKVLVMGKVSRPGPQYFTSANTLKLSEAVTTAMTTDYSELRKVRLTRAGRTMEYDVKAIVKEGRTDLDPVLQDGDQVYVPTVGIRWTSN